MPEGRRLPPFSTALALAFTSLALACSAGSASSDKTTTTGGQAGAATTGGAAGTTGGTGTAGTNTAGANTAGDTSVGGSGTAGASGSGAGGTGQAGAGQAGQPSAAGAPNGCNWTGPNGETFFDDFEDGELTCPEWLASDATMASLWTITTDGTSKVLTAASSSNNSVIFAAGDYAWSDQTIEAQVKFVSSVGQAIIFARVLDDSNYYNLTLDDSNLTLRGKVKLPGGSGTSLSTGSTNKLKDSALGITVTAGTWYTLKLSIAGKTATAWLNGTQVISIPDITASAYVDDPSLYVPNGGIGLGADGEQVEFDNVTVTIP
ncbi:MAG TPA: family 16 glycoside hydrolase [Polyangiaceae bacterium]